MDEFEIIRRYFTRAPVDAAVRVGIGDDGAVLSPAAGRRLVWAVDTLVDGVHYPAGMSARDVGYRAVEVNLSDLAAMGARPRWMTLALTLARNEAAWLDAFASGLFESAAAHEVTLVGGDTTRGERTVISVGLLGDVEGDRYLTRSGARPGDRVYVTGAPGDAAGGLALIEAEAPDSAAGEADRAYLRQRFVRPVARVAFGAAIAGLASAAIDVSDGLFADLGKLLDASGAGGRLEATELPLSAPLRRVFGDAKARQFALAGGDDYELCFTADPANERAVHSIANDLGLAVARIGSVEVGEGLRCYRDGEPMTFSDDGYRHF